MKLPRGGAQGRVAGGDQLLRPVGSNHPDPGGIPAVVGCLFDESVGGLVPVEDAKALADKKKIVTDRDIESIVGRNMVKFDGKYRFKYFAVNSATEVGATATVTLEWDEGKASKRLACIGEGMVEASFGAIDQITGLSPELLEYNVQAVTEGIDSQGEVTCRMSLDDITVTGSGASTDIIEASMMAYIDGVNKLVYEIEKRGAEN